MKIEVKVLSVKEYHVPAGNRCDGEPVGEDICDWWSVRLQRCVCPHLPMHGTERVGRRKVHKRKWCLRVFDRPKTVMVDKTA